VEAAHDLVGRIKAFDLAADLGVVVLATVDTE
jgi:hypothetical protein